MIKKYILFIVLGLLAVGCGKKDSAAGAKKPLVLVSIAPYQFLAQQIAGPEIEVRALVPSGANPHSFEPTSSQVAEMGRGEIWFRIGEPFEEKILPILKARNPNLAVYDLRSGIALIEEDHSHGLACTQCSMDHFDRHIWLSPKLAAKQAGILQGGLQSKYPEKAPLFQANLESLRLRLNALDLEIKNLLRPVKERVILVSHPAFGYFCKEYDFEQLSVEYEGKDPRPKHLEQILRKAVFQHAEVALALPQYNNKGAQLIADKLHLPVHLIDPYSPDYFETMKKLALLIADPHARIQ